MKCQIIIGNVFFIIINMQAIGEARRKVRQMGLDPFIVKNYNHTVGLFSVQLKNTWINGVSGFYRVGDLLLSLTNNTVTIGKNFLLIKQFFNSVLLLVQSTETSLRTRFKTMFCAFIDFKLKF